MIQVCWTNFYEDELLPFLTNFISKFMQEWLQKHGPFDAVVDGANVGYLKNYFDFNQVQIRQKA